ncbi:unnamed protein product, partial [Prorocentrum cordatum]
MWTILALFALSPVASSLSLHKVEAEEGAGDMLFALSSVSETQQGGERSEEEYTAISSLLSEAEALLQVEAATDREAAEEEIALLQEVDADEKVAEEELDADSDPEAPAAEASPEAPAAAAEAPREAAAVDGSEGTAANTSGNASEVQVDENQTRANLSTYFDPKLMAIFREKQAHLKETMK